MKTKLQHRPVAVCGSLENWPKGQPRPLFRDFMGLNETHLSGPARAKFYRPLGRLLRDYHSARSDLGDDSTFAAPMIRGRDGREWARQYRDLEAAGWRTIVSLMFERLEPAEWRDLAHDSRAYAQRFARTFATGRNRGRIEAVEIGNEPGAFSDEQYRTVLAAMGAELKAIAPQLRVGTAALTTGPSHNFYKSVDCLDGIGDHYDVLTLHTYAEIDGWPVWERSHPEDARLQSYLMDVHRLCRWRDEHVPDKEIWITEFGYDAIDLPSDKTGPWRHWRGLTDLQQAQWTLRSWLVFATLPVTRAYYFFFNDQGEPKMHHASGMTRHGERRPVFFASAHLQAVLGDYRLARVVLEQPGEAIVLEFTHETDVARRVWVAWSPTNSGRIVKFALPRPSGTVERAEYMPVDKRAVPADVAADARTITLTESPLYLFLRTKPAPTKKT